MTKHPNPAPRVYHSQPSQVGDGFTIRRPLPNQGLKQLSPFLLLDHAGPTEVPPSDYQRGVDEHPHRGFETVTIVYSGAIEHRDSAGHAGSIGPGGVQWMTAGAGVVHEEKHGREFSQQGGTLEMIQLWVNLPKAHKMTRPRYQEISAEQIPEVNISDSTVRVIAGNYQDETGPAQTFTPLTMLDLRLAANARLELPITDGYNTAVYVLRGSVRANGTAVGEAELAVVEGAGQAIHLEADAESVVLLLSGEPINEPVASYGPFVMNNSQELVQAMQDYEQGKMGTLAAEIL
ncbi:MAG: pirin family protein [Tunicatimonas sp.]